MGYYILQGITLNWGLGKYSAGKKEKLIGSLQKKVHIQYSSPTISKIVSSTLPSVTNLASSKETSPLSLKKAFLLPPYPFPVSGFEILRLAVSEPYGFLNKGRPQEVTNKIEEFLQRLEQSKDTTGEDLYKIHESFAWWIEEKKFDQNIIKDFENNLNFALKKIFLIQIAEETERIAKGGSFTTNNITYHLDATKVFEIRDPSVKKKSTCLEKVPEEKRNKHTTIVTVVNKDIVEVGREFTKKDLKPVCMNMAAMHYPGGGYLEGARAQEEQLFRRSAYCRALKDNPHLDSQLENGRYEVPEKGVIYSPGVQFFRERDNSFTEPFELDLMAVCAFDLSHRQKPSDYEQVTKEKMRAFFRAAALQGKDSLVLGALGCGAFRNQPTEISKCFKEVLSEEEFQGVFAEIAFAILDDQNGKNFTVFNEALGSANTSFH